MRRRIAVLSLVLWAGCVDSSLTTPQPAAGSGAAPIDGGAAERCEGAPVSRPATRVTELVDHLNALPKPTTLACLLESLARPLSVHATRSLLSAQPAVGQRSPRVFLFLDGLILSVALDGMGKHLLEFGELRPNARTVKAEVAFPVTAELTHAAPFERVLYQEGQTSCAFCHASESRDDSIDFTPAFASVAYRPSERQAQVTVAELAAELERCDPDAEPERCAMLGGLFARGMPSERDFPVDFVTFQ